MSNASREAIAESSDSKNELIVGREQGLQELRSSFGKSRMQSMWLYGMRRMGKSALACSALSRLREERGLVTLRIDTKPLAALSDLADAAAKASRAAGLQLAGGDPDGVFRSLGNASRSRPIVVYLDNFDHLAGQLGVAEQALLRAAAQEHGGLAFLIETRQPPTQLLEEVEERSRLAGICTTLPVRPLRRVDVEAFFARAAHTHSTAGLASLGKDVWATFGGFPWFLPRILPCLIGRSDLNDPGAVKDALEDVALRFEEDLREAWLQLPYELQAALTDSRRPVPDSKVLKKAGLHDETSLSGMLRPSALLDIAREQATLLTARRPNTLLEKAERLRELVYWANVTIRARSGRDGFRASNEMSVSWPLTRLPCNEDAFDRCVRYLYQLLWERTRSGPTESLLPTFLESKLKGAEVARWVNVLRNNYVHDKSKPTDATKHNRDVASCHEVHYQLVGARSLDNDESRQRARTVLIDRVIEFLEDFVECARSAPLDASGRYRIEPEHAPA